MNAEEFEAVLEQTFENMRKVLVEKAREYADDDRMHNFKVAAALMGCTPEQALWGFCVKHLVSISDMIRKNEQYTPEQWDEKLGDALNYLALLRALVIETQENALLETFIQRERDFANQEHDTTVHMPTSIGNQ